jgi:hypothetical protein
MTRDSNDVFSRTSGPQPGDFEVGSAQSRAAARHLLQKRLEGRVRREVIIGIDADKNPQADEYGTDPSSEEFSRVVAIPYGMSIADGLRAVGGCTEEELADPRLQELVHGAEIWSLVH